MTSAIHTPFSILFVDDDEMSRVHFARAIQGLYPVHLARNADEAIEILEEHGADIAVLVTDFRMPVSNGDQLLREAAQRYPRIVRILVTAYADKDMLLRTVNTGGVFRILEKPLRIETVRETLREAIAHWTERETRQHQLLAMDETLAFLAHELNTPLATIALIAQTIENGSAGEVDPMPRSKVTDAATSMLANAQYCMTLISSFWASLHKSGSAQSLSRAGAREVRATRLIATLLDTYPFSASQRDWITVDVQDDFVVRAMPNCVTLVLSSLLSNALRALSHTPRPALRIEVLDNLEPEIRVRDNGPGIAPEIKARLLRDSITTHAEEGGHGMGMIFCNRIMRSFGGGLEIDSAVGVGTTVTMRFGTRNERAKSTDAKKPLEPQSSVDTPG
ncbi:hybrid sensor histidine kinase/response regulator [Paraburkholderia guartelaensis]|uniref:hybrid sensor histidine kinase/response regulator n=1 Tax=Paraburkholderia guartelaensis TaxID=2546446 RepID=UPI002AB68AE2|nr:hybrid sensor histidine kinase/response regulator [Paraburkholderia guartelaensis]